MPIITLPYQYLEELTGTDRDTIIDRLPMIGADIERFEDDHTDVEFFPDRPDLFSTEGVARAMKGFLEIETGPVIYETKPSGITITVDENIAPIRPYIGSAVIRGLTFSGEAIESLMGLQEALHWAVGRGRGKVAIGVHDLSTVTPPFRYFGADPKFSFVPLDFEEEMTMEEMLTKHPKGVDYAHLVRDFDLYPLITDANGSVLSFPPIINGELTRVTEQTTDILLDCTGTDLKAVTTAVKIICASLVEAGGTIESVEINGKVWPNLKPEKRTINVDECNRLLGLELSAGEIAAHLEAMRFGAIPHPRKGEVEVQVPCYRADVMHDWDVFEDVAIAYGFENFEPQLPATFTVGREHPKQTLMGAVRQIMTGLGYLEMMPFTLTSRRVLFDQMQRPYDNAVLPVLHPISEEQTLIRTDLLPLLMEILQHNHHRELPQKIFHVGDAIDGTETIQKMAAVSIHTEADFSEIFAAADVLCRNLGLVYTLEESDDPAFIEGRRGDIIVDGVKRGVFGELHPAVITAFELDQPTAGFELDLRALD